MIDPIYCIPFEGFLYMYGSGFAICLNDATVRKAFAALLSAHGMFAQISLIPDDRKSKSGDPYSAMPHGQQDFIHCYLQDKCDRTVFLEACGRPLRQASNLGPQALQHCNVQQLTKFVRIHDHAQ